MNNNEINNLEKYLEKNPDDYKIRSNLAFLFIKQNLINKAVRQYKIILNKREDLQTMFNLGICYSNLKKFQESEKVLNRVIKKNKKHFNALRALGDISLKQEKIKKAYKYLKLAKKINDKDPILLNLLGALEMKLLNYSEAEKNLLQSLNYEKNYISPKNNLAILYQKIGKIEKSYKILNDLITKFPNDINLLNNLGSVLIDLNKYELAIDYLNKAIEIDSSESAFFSNLGRAYFFQESYTKSKKILEKALFINSNNYEAKIILFYLSIIEKDLQNAWKNFSARIYTKKYFIPFNLSTSNKIENKKILILREAGLGDEVLYSSMYKELININQNVIIECDPRLKNIFKRSFKYNNFVKKSALITKKSNLNKFDISIYAGSLCNIFRNKFSTFNYNKFLQPNLKLSQKYYKKLNNINNYPKIGISWISKRTDIGKDKSIDLIKLLPIFKKKKLSFVNLQYGIHEKTIKNFNKKNNVNIIDFEKMDKFKDIEELLALINSLDLVITVSNTTAHLSGSIGKKTLLLAPNNRAQLFYWMFYKNKTPWYPSINIIKKNKNWNEAIQKININLDKIFKN